MIMTGDDDNDDHSAALRPEEEVMRGGRRYDFNSVMRTVMLIMTADGGHNGH